MAEETIAEKYELETLLMGEDDDMAKKAVYLGRTLAWGENVSNVLQDTCMVTRTTGNGTHFRKTRIQLF